MKQNAFNQGMPRLWLPPKILLAIASSFLTGSHETNKQLLRVMKLTIVIMTLFLVQVSAATFAQKLTYKKKGATLKEVFAQIRLQTGYHVLYSEQKLDLTRKLDINFKDTNLNEVLSQLIDEGLEYSIENKDIFIKRKSVSITDRIVAIFTNINVHGRVIDGNGNAILGANVSVKGKSRATVTGDNGDFYLPGIDEKAVLEISFVGYQTKKIAVKPDMGNIVLELIESKLDEVQVIAYGTEQKRFSVGSVYTVTADIIGKQPITNPLLALQGQAPGLSVIAMNGVPGSTTLVQLRGQNSLATDRLSFKPYDQPYFIVDGVPFAPQNVNISQLSNLANGQSFSGGLDQNMGIGAFNNINPSDIESITILKDADATAIYGTKGAHGVILITTKKGKAGNTTVDLNVNRQVNAVARPIKLLNTEQYLDLRKQAFDQDGLIPNNDPNDYSGAYAPDLTVYDQNKYTNWQKIIQGDNTHNTDMHISVSGGNDYNTYMVSGGYTRSDYNYPGDFADKRYSLHSALTNSSSNKKLNLTLITDYTYERNNSAGGFGNGILLPPNGPDQKDKDGKLIWNYKGVPINQNFYAGLLTLSELQSFNFNSSLNVDYEILNGLKIGANMGYSRNTSNEHSINPSTAQNPTYINITAAFANTAAQNVNIDPQINYTAPIGKGEFTALLGGTYQKGMSDFYQTQAYGYSNDAFLGSINGSSSQAPFNVASLIKYVALFGRLKYVYDQKYILEFSGRRDGSSNFGPGNQFGTFGSVGAGWIFSEERPFKDGIRFISYGKLSGSYGTTGSDASQGYKFPGLV